MNYKQKSIPQSNSLKEAECNSGDVFHWKKIINFNVRFDLV